LCKQFHSAKRRPRRRNKAISATAANPLPSVRPQTPPPLRCGRRAAVAAGSPEASRDPPLRGRVQVSQRLLLRLPQLRLIRQPGWCVCVGGGWVGWWVGVGACGWVRGARGAAWMLQESPCSIRRASVGEELGASHVSRDDRVQTWEEGGVGAWHPGPYVMMRGAGGCHLRGRHAARPRRTPRGTARMGQAEPGRGPPPAGPHPPIMSPSVAVVDGSQSSPSRRHISVSSSSRSNSSSGVRRAVKYCSAVNSQVDGAWPDTRVRPRALLFPRRREPKSPQARPARQAHAHRACAPAPHRARTCGSPLPRSKAPPPPARAPAWLTLRG
jgi:hypothetical protein